MESQGTTTVDSEPLVLAYLQAKQYDDLIRVLQLQVTVQDGAPSARLRLAAAYSAAGRKADALSEVESLVKAHPEASAQAAQFVKSLIL